MPKISDETLELVEKTLDTVIKYDDYSVLGIPIPSSFEEVGAVGAVVTAHKFFSYISERQFSKSFQKFSLELQDLSYDQKQRYFNKYSKKNG